MATPKYSYQENPSNELTGFKIEDGKYKDVIYTYGKVSPIEESEKLRSEAKILLDKSQAKLNSAKEESKKIIDQTKRENENLIIEMNDKFHKS